MHTAVHRSHSACVPVPNATLHKSFFATFTHADRPQSYTASLHSATILHSIIALRDRTLTNTPMLFEWYLLSRPSMQPRRRPLTRRKGPSSAMARISAYVCMSTRVRERREGGGREGGGFGVCKRHVVERGRDRERERERERERRVRRE